MKPDMTSSGAKFLQSLQTRKMWSCLVLFLVIGALCYTSDAYSECYRWTKWLNRDLPSGTGDFETVIDFRKLTTPPVCANPVGIECRTVGSHVNHTQNGQVYDCDLWRGGVCRNTDQSDGRCDNYEVRFLCPCGSISSNFLESSSQQCRWSSYDDRDNPSGFGDYETIRDIHTQPCTSSEDRLGIQCVSLSGQDFRQTGAVRYHCNQRSGGYCVNSEQNGGYCKDYKVRYLCCPRAPPPPPPPPVETCYQWTKWLNRDLPSGAGDFETFHDFRKLTTPPVCANPVGVECRTVGSHINHTQNGEVYDCDLWRGGVCRNTDQSDGRCDNYEVRFLCPCGSISSNFQESSSQQCRWSSYDDRDNPSGFGDYETIRDIRTQPCTSSEDRLGIQCVSLSGQDFRQTGAVRYHCNQRSGGYCVNSEQNGGYCKDYKVRHLCCPRAPPPPPVETCYQWTKWLNRDLPSGTGDFETFHDFRKLTTPPVCANPVGIECRTVGSHVNHTQNGEMYDCDLWAGGVCRNTDQSDGRCDNYEVRFLCPCGSISSNFLESSRQCRWSTYYDRDNPSGYGDNETIRDIRTPPCNSSEDRLGIQCVSLRGQDFRQTGAVRYHCNQRRGGYCVNSEQNGDYCKDYKVRYLCCPRAPPPPPVETCYRWTKWLNRDLLSGTGDFETFRGSRKLIVPPVCANPIGIECRTVVNHRQEGELYSCEVSSDGVCRNTDQSDRRCENYELRFLCPCDSISESSSFLVSPNLLLVFLCVVVGHMLFVYRTESS